MNANEKKRRRICVVTGTRAEYGLLRSVMAAIVAAPDLQLQVLATAAHLAPEFGYTANQIEQDGFPIDARVEMLLSSDTAIGTAKSMGLAQIGFADAFAQLNPDLIVVLGDRFEILAAAATALVMRIPVAHVSGGDVTAGAFDDAMRHAITKMAHLHFVATEESARRVRQLGEEPSRIHLVGDPGLDLLRQLELLNRSALETALGIALKPRNLLLTFHPATLSASPASDQFAELLAALDGLGPEIGLLFTKPNADPEGRRLAAMLDEFVAERDNAWAFTSLGQLLYLSAMKHCDAVVGNSSSGLLEAPSLRKPTVNIGDRQAGRVRAASVTDCPPERRAIRSAIEAALDRPIGPVTNPYGDGHSAERIVAVLRQPFDKADLLFKTFRDIS